MERRTTGIPSGPKYRSDGPGFDRISRLGACAVGFDIGCLGRIQARSVITSSDEFLLCQLTGRGNSIGPAVLVHPSLADDGTDRIAVTDRIIQAFQDDRCRSFATSVSVCSTIKRKGFAICREKAGCLSIKVSLRPYVISENGEIVEVSLTIAKTLRQTCQG